MLNETMGEGGPYQAAIIIQTFNEMQLKFRRSPADEQTEERRKVIQYLSDVELTASFIRDFPLGFQGG
jgi:hypothetical protein